jgi:uncharacterized protein YndB with AHSA1/START domain
MTTDDGSSTPQTPPAMTARPEPVGRREARQGDAYVLIERSFHAPVEDVWAAVTEPERLARWIGTWSGDPASGVVQFRMTAEGEDIEAEPVTVHECDPPRRLALSWVSGPPASGVWEVELDLTEEAGRTTLTFAQRVPDTATGRDVGPGWEYYLDRLVTALGDGDLGAVVWADYEGMAGHYEKLFADLP